MLMPSEREKLQDCQLLVQSAQNILSALPPKLESDLTEIVTCFQAADKTLSELLRG
jgi:hypothetical protein